MMACCSTCAQLGDVAASGTPSDSKRPLIVVALSVVGLAALLFLMPEKKRYKRMYADPWRE